MNDHNTCRTISEGKKIRTFKLSLSAEIYDPRAEYVQTVLDVLRESRCPGPTPPEFFSIEELISFDEVYFAAPLIEPEPAFYMTNLRCTAKLGAIRMPRDGHHPHFTFGLTEIHHTPP